jgi:RNA polymerase sigma-70 factor (ECF subfamily)
VAGINWVDAKEGPRIGPAIDRSTIDRARNGDRDAFALIVRARKDAVYRLCFAILGNEADAADAAQGAFIATWRQLPALRDPERFDAWLQRVVVNGARQVLRAKRRRGLREIPASSVIAMAEGPASRALSDASVLDAALQALAVEQRSILVLHHLEGRSLAEIAEILGAPVGTAKSRLFAARKALAAAIEREQGR